MADAPLAQGIERFAAYLRNERRYSPATLSNYARSLRQLREYLEAQSVTRWREVRGEQIQAFIARTHRAGLSPGSLRDMLSAYR
ncbi:MAG: site-specific integrase, partial [Proteobacteria bacterium]|nr:site-specific integrase [Pseudomonadota bacterium]